VEPDDIHAAVSRLIGTDAQQLAVLDDPFIDLGDQRMDLLEELATSAAYRPVVLLTDQLDTLGWAISLPDDVGMVTGLPPEPLQEASVPIPDAVPFPDPSDAVAPSTSSS
jgi:hypothetical protein